MPEMFHELLFGEEDEADEGHRQLNQDHGAHFGVNECTTCEMMRARKGKDFRGQPWGL